MHIHKASLLLQKPQHDNQSIPIRNEEQSKTEQMKTYHN